MLKLKDMGQVINRYPTCKSEEVVLRNAELPLAVKSETLSLATRAKA
jgi:hypothetical protein